MRNKIIAVNAAIVLIIGLLSWVLMRGAITSVASNQGVLLSEAKHGVQGAAARVQLDSLRAERWLSQKASEPASVEPFQKSTDSARKEAATSLCDRVLSDSRAGSTFEGIAPSVVMLIDENGKLLGRNGSNLNAGRDISADYATFKDALTKGRSGSDIWANKDRQDSFLASYAPVRASDGHVAGMLAIGVTLGDELQRVSEQTTGRSLALVVPQGADLSLVATANGSLQEATSGAPKDLLKRVLDGGKADAVSTGDTYVGAALLDGLGDGKHAAIASAAPGSLIDNAGALATPLLFVTGLGVVLVFFGGWGLGNYITRPINLLEEGLLAILNGQQDKRFELDHPELGGLAFRIDQLLNQLMGIEEDTTDEQGRPSKAPSAADFREAMSVDRSTQGAVGEGQQVDPAAAQALAAEPAPQYYGRIYREYINAKKALGEATDHITEQAFSTRIQGMERDAAQKYGRPVRYQVHARNKEVVLLAVPLPQ
ncbi:MAG TPA: MXAN_5187 C-terminal domain-containing protein [Polyangiaceae bacterium]